MFSQNMFHLPHKDLIWGIEVRKKDLPRVLSLLEKEGLIPVGNMQMDERP